MRYDPARLKRTARIARIVLAVAILAYGLAISEPGMPKFFALTLTLFALPLLLQVVHSPLLRAYALWFGVFLVVQSVLTPVLTGGQPDLILNRPNLEVTLNFTDGIGPGLPGPQVRTTDQESFRVSPRIDYAHKSGMRIFAIGGSTTEQETLNDEATWTHRVQTALSERSGQRVEVVNAGVRALRAKHHLATLKHILPFHPDMVLFLSGVNDWNFDALQRFGSDLPDPPKVFSSTLLGGLLVAEYDRLIRVRPLSVSRIRPLTGPPSMQRARKISWLPETASDQYLQSLLKISAICHENKLTCVFLTQPSSYQTDAPDKLKEHFWMTPQVASYTLTFDSLVHVAGVYNRSLLEFAKQHDHPSCDLAPKISATTENFYDDVHFTDAGSQHVAEAVTECIGRLLPEITRAEPERRR